MPAGIVFNGGQTDHAFYKEVNIEPEDLFAMKFDYTTTNTNTGAIGQFNGNISQIEWRTKGNDHTSIYGFEYDDLNRLVNAKYVEKPDEQLMPNKITYDNEDHYSVSNITYDLNGNIKTLDRMGWNGNSFTQIDQMSYTSIVRAIFI